MAKWLISFFALCFTSTGISAQAGTQSEAVIALHALTLQFKGDACQFGPITSCLEYEVDENPLDLNVTAYLMIGMADSSSGVAGLSCGIAISTNVAIGNWILCADSDIRSGGWPSTDGGGIKISWDPLTNCQRDLVETIGVHALVGAFVIYAYGNSWVEITANKNISPQEFSITDCADEVSDVALPGGKLGFGTEKGFNPCLDSTPTEPRTWGRIKGFYRKP